MTTAPAQSWDVATVRGDFPILSRRLAGDKPLVYLDSANTSHKPRVVLEAMDDHFRHHNANVARAMHQIGAEATEAFETARDRIAAFVKAPSRDEIVFTKNASEALNLVASTLGDSGRIGAGDNVVITQMEHHSNIVPWQFVTRRTQAELRWFGVTDDGRLDLSRFEELIDERTRVVSLTWVSNMLGTVNPLETVIARARQVGALVVVDASQAVPQLPVDFGALGADLVAFTGHKMVGPTGIGVLWGRYELLAELPPFLGGGEMIETVTMESSTFAPPPHRFEAGTPPIGQAVALGVAAQYLTELGMENIAAHEQRITAYALDLLQGLPGVQIIGPTEAVDRGGAVSFTVDGVHPHDVSQVLDAEGIAVRAGHHCAKPLHDRFGVQSSTRASFYLYTTEAEIEALAAGIQKVQHYFKVA